LRDRAAQSVTAVETPSPSPSPPPRAESPKPSPRAEKPRGRSSPLDRATGLFSDGKTQEALKALDAAGDGRESKVLRAKIDKFNKVYAQALVEHRNKRTQTAIKQLKQAKAYVSKIVSGKSRIADEIHRKLADMHYVQGMEPMLSRRYAEAYKNFRTAVTYMPGHGPSSRQLEALSAKAKELYEEGYRLKDTDPDTARERWKLVMKVVPNNNEYYRKAKQRLNALP
jgi:tetratricopeptide (TPR) repeat protein